MILRIPDPDHATVKVPEVTLATPALYSRITAIVANVDGDAKRSRKGKLNYSGDDSSYRFQLEG